MSILYPSTTGYECLYPQISEVGDPFNLQVLREFLGRAASAGVTYDPLWSIEGEARQLLPGSTSDTQQSVISHDHRPPFADPDRPHMTHLLNWMRNAAENKDLIDYFSAYNRQIEVAAQHPSVSEALASTTLGYLEALMAAEEAGYNVGHAVAELDLHIYGGGKAFNVLYTDKLYMGLHKYSALVQFHESQTPDIVFGVDPDIDEGVPELVSDIEDSMYHELGHVVLGRLRDEWADEAINEHFAEFLKGNRGFREVSPGGEGSYLQYRSILSDLIEVIGDASEGDFSAMNVFDGFVGNDKDELMLYDDIEAYIGFDVFKRTTLALEHTLKSISEDYAKDGINLELSEAKYLASSKVMDRVRQFSEAVKGRKELRGYSTLEDINDLWVLYIGM